MPLPMSPVDSVFLTVESRTNPMHVGGLHLYQTPEGADSSYVHDVYQSMIAVDDVAPLFRKRPRRSLASGGQWAWEDDAQFDIEHHVQHNALPRPGRVLELLALCSRLHSTLLDRQRPLWEAHLIEGLADGRFAIYFKIHHALVDGISAQRLLQSVLSNHPDQRGMAPPWADRSQPARTERPAAAASSTNGLLGVPMSTLRSALRTAGDAAGLPSALLTTINRSLHDQSSSVSFSAPKSMFNVPITGSRRFAAQSWPIERINGVRRAAGSGITVNDVVLAMCAGALRAYMNSLDALPAAPLIAMVPVALRAKDQAHRQSGNAVGAVMVNLGTHLDNPDQRLKSVHKSMSAGKEAMRGMTPLQIQAMSGIGMSPLVLQPLLKLQGLARPPFNLIISNVPGPRAALYLNGAKLDGMYPLSIPFDGQALNITCTSYDKELAFGLTGCRRSVPHLQRMLGHLDDELTALEKVVGAD